MGYRWVFASDIDNTLTGDRDALDDLRAELHRKWGEQELFVILSTGRRLEQVISGLEEEGLPEPDAVVSQVGTEIYLPPLRPDKPPLDSWKERLQADYSREEARSFLEGLSGVEMQPDIFNTPLKVSCWLKGERPEETVRTLRSRCSAVSDRYQVVWSSGQDLDILPAAAGKGKAIRFLLEERGIDTHSVVVAGDSGNDSSMFQAFDRGIMVGNAKPELLALKRKFPENRWYAAEDSYAAGVKEGLEHFGLL